MLGFAVFIILTLILVILGILYYEIVKPINQLTKRIDNNKIDKKFEQGIRDLAFRTRKRAYTQIDLRNKLEETKSCCFKCRKRNIKNKLNKYKYEVNEVE